MPPPETVRAPVPPRRAARRWAAAVLALAALAGGGAVLFQVIVRLKHKDGTETVITAPPGTTVEVEHAGKVVVVPTPKTQPPALKTASPTAAGAWAPGTPEGSLPGLLPRQARFPGLGRWQLETVAPRDGSWPNPSWSSRGSIARINVGGGVRVYNGETFTLERLILSPEHPIFQWCVAWNPAGTAIAVGSTDYVVRVWKADGQLIEFQQECAVAAVAWSPDGRRFASAGETAKCVSGTRRGPRDRC